MKIANRLIAATEKPFVIAEMSNNHLCDLDLALKMIEVAAESGADAIKIQTYSADSLTIDCDQPDFVIQDPLWAGKTYYELYQEIAAPLAWTAILFKKARSLDLIIFSSPFDEQAVELLEGVDCPAYKIASFEIEDFALLKAVAKTGKPVILSTGIANLETVKRSIEFLRANGSGDIAVLHCVSSYPASYEQMNLNAIEQLNSLGVITGLSDHSLSNIPAIASIAMGGRIIEKHFTVDRKLGGPDAEFSLEPHELKSLVISCQQSWEALGNSEFINSEKRPGKQHGRSVYVVKDIAAGERFTDRNIRVIRPGFGLSPSHYEAVLGCTASESLKRGTALAQHHINDAEIQSD